MTVAAVEALRADHQALSALAGTFTAEEWAAPSACDGWAVRDVLVHMNQLFRQLVDPSSLPPGDPSGLTERTMDVWVEARRDQPTDEVLADYRALGGQAVAFLATIQDQDNPLDLGDLGTHPLHLVANAFSFDHYTHIRADLLGPEGPLDRPAPPTDEAHLAAAADWIVAGIPQMSPAAITAPIDLVLTGPGGRTVRFGGAGEGDDNSEPAATVTSSVDDLVRWSSGRRSWKELDVTITGDHAAGAHFCDTVHVF
jgi:uncharacterized protein (TIGR03083 family)